MGKGEIIQGLDLLDVVNFINKKSKTFQAIFLQDLEEIIPKDSESFIAIRKLFLDSFNNYTRSVFNIIFGSDFENGK